MTKTRFKDLRKSIGYSQAKLAQEMGISIRTITRWERGDRPIPRYAELALRTLVRDEDESRPNGEAGRVPDKVRLRLEDWASTTLGYWLAEYQNNPNFRGSEDQNWKRATAKAYEVQREFWRRLGAEGWETDANECDIEIQRVKDLLSLIASQMPPR